MEQTSTFFKDVENRVKEKLDTATELKKNVFGFSINIEEETKKGVDGFIKNQNSFNEELTKTGIQPLAILPYDLWEGLCKQAGLIRFEHLNRDGVTYTTKEEAGSDSYVAYRKTHPLPPLPKRYYLIRYAIISAIFLSAVFLFNFLPTTNLSGFLYWLGGTVLISGIIFLQGLACRGNERIKVWKKTPERYFPTGIDMEEFEYDEKRRKHNNGGHHKVEVAFKDQAGDKVLKEKLEKMISVEKPIYVAADSGAIVINKVGLSENYKEWLENDPILYTTTGEGNKRLVAIIAQAGKLPNEEAVMKYVCEEYSVLNLLN